MGKVLSFRNGNQQAQENKNVEGEKMYKKADYFVLGEINGTEFKVPFEGTVYTECEKCGQVIDMDIHELVEIENENEDFTEFGAWTCHECLQKEKQEQATGLGKMGLAVLEMMNIVQDEMKSVSDRNKDALMCFLGEALDINSQNGIAMQLEQVRGYADALHDNGLMDDAEYDMLTMSIDAA